MLNKFRTARSNNKKPSTSSILRHRSTPVLEISIVTLVLIAVFLLTVVLLNQNTDTDSTEPLVIVWEYAEATPDDLTELNSMPPVQIVSPTWFKFENSDGSIRDMTDQQYIDWARKHNYEIWVLASNPFDDPDTTAALLSNPKSRQAAVDNLINLSLHYEFEGINIDFENFHSSYRDYFTEFITELAVKCRANNIILSVDVTMISGSEYWSLGYDRAALAEAADYIILMAYDEHWKASTIAGSVASLPWVENGLQRILQEVPAAKLILGVPFYTRLWEIDESGDSPVVIGSQSYSMHRAAEIIEDNNAVITWDDTSGQNLASFQIGNRTYKLWLEDSTSMKQRLELVDKYQLAGIAAWRRGLEKLEIWELIEQHFSE